MSDVTVNKAEASNELVALYLLTSIAAGEGSTINIKDGIPVISGKDKAWIINNYVDCLKSVIRRENKSGD